MFKTLDNYDIGFLVFVHKTENVAFVYGRTEDVVIDDCDELLTFDNLRLQCEPLEIFIGKSSLNQMTEFSGGHGEKFDGNSVLLRVGHVGEFRYVYVGTCMFEFVTDEPIINYVSSVGNNCVPYPYAQSQNYCYDMCDRTKASIYYHPNREFFGHGFGSDAALYQSLEVKEISGRDSRLMRYLEKCEETTLTVEYMDSDEQFEYAANTCVDERLPLVNKMNEILIK